MREAKFANFSFNAMLEKILNLNIKFIRNKIIIKS